MSKKILLGVLGSPRKAGNSELFVKELHSNLPPEWELRLMRLPELDIRPCRACYKCLFGEMRCPIKDDFQIAMDALVSADAFAIAAPAYLLGANASLKNFLDRGLGLYGRIDELWGKPAVGVAIAGVEGMEGYTKLVIDSFIKLVYGDHRGSAVLYGALPGEIFLEGDGKAVAARFAAALTGEAKPAAPDSPVCPLCGGDTFRFLPGGLARCMVCSSAGRYEWADGRLDMRMERGGHPFFLTYDDARNHAEWLRGMKEKFLARRNELKEVTQSYTQEVVWVRRPDDGSAKE